MSVSSDFEAMQEQLKQASGEQFLGRLVWFVIREVKMDHGDLCRILISLGLNGYLPPPPNDVDVFRRVCTAAQRKKVPTGDPAVWHNYSIRDVGTDTGHLYKVVVRETVDTKGRKLSHDAELCSITFDRKNATVDTACQKEEEQSHEIAEEVKAAYKDERGMVDSGRVRNIFRTGLENCQGLNLRGQSGGLYFVPEPHAERLAPFEQLADTLGGECVFGVHPCFDVSKYREIVRRAYEEETMQEIESLLGEISKVVKEDKGVSKDTYADYFLRRLHEIGRRTQDYSTMLEETLGNAGSHLHLLQQAVMNLSGLIRE